MVSLDLSIKNIDTSTNSYINFSHACIILLYYGIILFGINYVIPHTLVVGSWDFKGREYLLIHSKVSYYASTYLTYLLSAFCFCLLKDMWTQISKFCYSRKSLFRDYEFIEHHYINYREASSFVAMGSTAREICARSRKHQFSSTIAAESRISINLGYSSAESKANHLLCSAEAGAIINRST